MQANWLCIQTKSFKTGRANACGLLTNANIQREIEAIEAENHRATGISARRVLRELASIAFADIGDVFESGSDGLPRPREWNTIPVPSRRVISNVKVKRRKLADSAGEWIVEELDFKFHDKLAALDKLAKHLGLTSDGEALRQLLELVGQNRTDASGGSTATSWDTDGPGDGEAPAADRPADKAVPAKG